MLTPREEEVAALAASGLSNKEIARRLRVSPLTVKNQLKSVFRKCDASNRTEMGAKLFR
jgi:DNA-binding NarL/FixJ family response regulator